MDHAQHNRMVNFIWSIADDEQRDVHVRGKYRDVIIGLDAAATVFDPIDPKNLGGISRPEVDSLDKIIKA